MKPDSATNFFKERGTLLVCLLLTICPIAAYWQLHISEFINLDDPFMIYQNPIVSSGWTAQGFIWGLTTSYFDYWHPLTWWSYMTDCQLFGMLAPRFHLVSLGFHVLNTLILFAAFRALTGMMVRSAIVAALFALHPMHVESVAWLAERKDVLSTLFWAVSLWAYARYFKAPQGKGGQAELFFRLSVFSFLCGVMSKPMVVTLPFVMLLLDYWPLNRLAAINFSSADGKGPENRRASLAIFWSLVGEKLPFFGIALFSSIITYSGMKTAHSVISTETIPWSLRLSNVPVSYARYLAKFVWPARMSLFYPLPNHWEFWQVAVSLLAIVIISGMAIYWARQAPYLIVGWLIFLGTLIPTISLVPVGLQAMADRFTYLPYLGLFVALVWTAAEISTRWRFRNILLSTVTAVMLVGCFIVTRIQVGYWQGNFTLWPHCIAVTSGNFTAHYNYGYALQNAGQIKEAIVHYREALRIRPDYIDANLNLGRALAGTGELKEATNYFANAVRFQPASSDAHGNLGAAIYELGDFPGAAAECAESLRLNPSDFRSLVYLARALGQENKFDDAVHYFSQALRINPASAELHYYLGLEYLKHNLVEEAISNFTEAVRLNPSYTEARTQLDLALAKRSAAAPPGKLTNPDH